MTMVLSGILIEMNPYFNPTTKPNRKIPMNHHLVAARLCGNQVTMEIMLLHHLGFGKLHHLRSIIILMRILVVVYGIRLGEIKTVGQTMGLGCGIHQVATRLEAHRGSGIHREMMTADLEQEEEVVVKRQPRNGIKSTQHHGNGHIRRTTAMMKMETTMVLMIVFMQTKGRQPLMNFIRN